MQSESVASKPKPRAPSTPVEIYCRKLYRRVHRFWRAREGQYETWPNGFRILYTPPVYRPPLLIAGFQPGGDHDDVTTQQLRRWPSGNEYVDQHWPVARMLQKIFGRAGKLDLLRASVGTNVVFFRARDVDTWNQNPLIIRKELERFSRDEFIKLVSCIEPQAILAVGLKTFKMLDEGSGYTLLNKKRKTLMRSGRFRGTQVFGLSQEHTLSDPDRLKGLLAGLRRLN